MITIKIKKGIDLVEYYIEPEEIKFLKKEKESINIPANISIILLK